MDFDFKIEGAAEIERLLKALPDQVARKVLNSAGRTGANVLKKEIESRAPILKGPARVVKYRGKKRIIAPGVLKKNITVRLNKEKTTTTGKVSFWITTTRRAWYAHFLEWGTSKMSAQPFFRPALDAKGAEVIQKTSQEIMNKISQVIARLRVEKGVSK